MEQLEFYFFTILISEYKYVLFVNIGEGRILWAEMKKEQNCFD